MIDPCAGEVLKRKKQAALLGGWFLLVLLAGGAVVFWHWQALKQNFEQETAALFRRASQLAGQHDAHLTALSAVALAPGDPGHHLFLEVAQSIQRYYPRIDEIWLVPLSTEVPAVGIGLPDPAVQEMIRQAALSSTGQVVLLRYAQRPNHYLLVKRSPNTTQAHYGLAMAVDASQLILDTGTYWQRAGVFKALAMPDDVLLTGRDAVFPSLYFSRALSSDSQPLVLKTGAKVNVLDLVDFPALMLVLMAASLVYWAGLASWRARSRTRAALEQARISALDSRLAHASRVNVLGEMASGLVHELTQPLTSILALTQASRRLLSRGEYDALAPVLDDTVAQARRGASLLAHFRNWSRPESMPAQVMDFREVVDNVRMLLATEVATRQVSLQIQMPDAPVGIRGDAVEMEQVVFNLLRNALDAVQCRGGDGCIAVSLRQEAGQAILDVHDNGPGVPEALRADVFSPFVTGRQGGTGLGLALCRRLVERAHGEVFLMDVPEGGLGAHFRVELPACRYPDGVSGGPS